MDITILRILATLLSFAAFIGVFVWAYLPRHSAGFDEAARLPFEEEGTGVER